MALPIVHFDTEEIRLSMLFDNTEKMGYTTDSLKCKKIEDVYGKLMFGDIPEDRPITYASYVMSIDGKIAFEDSFVGPLIAKTNHLDPGGAKADFWVLNMLRGVADGIIIGSGTLIKEPDYTGSVFDEDISNSRIEAGLPIAPWTVIVTASGTKIPFSNDVFVDGDVSILINTSPNGFKNLKKEITKPYFIIDYTDMTTIKKQIEDNIGSIPIVITGEGSNTNAEMLLKVLKAMGMERVLIESPTYCHHLMETSLLDEMFLNTSCIFVGGHCASIGGYSEPFTSVNHPHTEIVSIHMHSPHFIYTRHKLIYGITK
ncbi:dihydrofolate reductase family protein [Schnuerera ultunensis]|uniref:dihydrofolate reductase family protein n=1 Tax=Schnuerera ultunensis TaxID=45497 RepID=UPI0004213EB2|nr:dihydrofolate reductase family protein [Schnuerera ultunensis]